MIVYCYHDKNFAVQSSTYVDDTKFAEAND